MLLAQAAVITAKLFSPLLLTCPWAPHPRCSPSHCLLPPLSLAVIRLPAHTRSLAVATLCANPLDPKHCLLQPVCTLSPTSLAVFRSPVHFLSLAVATLCADPLPPLVALCLALCPRPTRNGAIPPRSTRAPPMPLRGTHSTATSRRHHAGDNCRSPISSPYPSHRSTHYRVRMPRTTTTALIHIDPPLDRQLKAPLSLS